MSKQQEITDNSADVDISKLEDSVAVETQEADDFFKASLFYGFY